MLLIGIAVPSAVLAAFIKSDLDLASKVLMGAAGLMVFGIWFQLSEMNKQLGKVLYFVRVNYIANEMRRLDPDDSRPAKKILRADLEKVLEDEWADDSLRGFSVRDANVFVYTLWTFGWFIGTLALVEVWP